MPLLRLIAGHSINYEMLSWLKVSMYQKNSHQKIFVEREDLIINVEPHQKSPLNRECYCDRL